MTDWPEKDEIIVTTCNIRAVFDRRGQLQALERRWIDMKANEGANAGLALEDLLMPDLAENLKDVEGRLSDGSFDHNDLEVDEYDYRESLGARVW